MHLTSRPGGASSKRALAPTGTAIPTVQLILNESGSGLHQVRGGPIERLAPGDTAIVGRGIVHWHGAAPEAGLRQVSIGFGGTTNWGAPVTDAGCTGGGEVWALGSRLWATASDAEHVRYLLFLAGQTARRESFLAYPS